MVSSQPVTAAGIYADLEVVQAELTNIKLLRLL